MGFYFIRSTLPSFILNSNDLTKRGSLHMLLQNVHHQRFPICREAAMIQQGPNVIFIASGYEVDFVLSWHIAQPDLASQITTHKAKKTSYRNYYDLDQYIRHISYSCTSYCNTNSQKQVATYVFPYSFCVHPIWITELQYRMCRILKEYSDRIADKGTCHQYTILPSIKKTEWNAYESNSNR